MAQVTEHHTRRERTNEDLAKIMRTWAIVALILGTVGSPSLPNAMVIFDGQIQEVWQYVRYIGWAATMFSLPLSAALFVGAILVRRMPTRAETT